MRVWQWVSLIFTTWFCAQLAFGADTYAEWYAPILKVAAVVLYAFVAPSLVIAGLGRVKASSLRLFVGFVNLLVLAISAYLIFGFIEYVAGVPCVGLFGTRDASNCVQTKTLFLSLLMLPPVFLPTTLILAAGFAKGLIEQRGEGGRLF